MTTQASRVVVVAGASSGIGRATAHQLAERGDRVVLAARSADVLETVAKECLDRGADDVMVAPVDVTDEAAVQALVDDVVTRFGAIDAWVHAAAVMAYGRFDQTPSHIWRRVVETELFGTVNAARAALPVMTAQGDGVFLVVTSVLGRVVTPSMSAYVTSKWALRGFVRALQIEMRDVPGVVVTAVAPGAVNTPIYAQAANFAGTASRPPPPVDQPEKVAAVILRTLDRPGREHSVGLANGLMAMGFSALPFAYDRLVGPLMRRVGFLDRAEPATEGNVFAPAPIGNAVRASWTRRWSLRQPNALRARGGSGRARTR